MTRYKIVILLCFFFSITSVYGEEISFNGKLSGWINFYDSGIDSSQVGFRYLPDFKISHGLGGESNIDAEISFNLYTSAIFSSISDFTNNVQIDPYRIYLRYSTSQFETRVGLQKINFGSATILRPLMWFDKVDPRDPLQLTNGVYGLMAKYVFLNNSNLWFWGLYGNNDTKGIEMVKAAQNTIEVGGRFQFSIPKSELAVTFHTRKLDPNDWNAKYTSRLSDGTENRLALDGKFDIGIGLWFEGMMQQTIISSDQTQWDNLLTIGADYTVKLGNGVYVLGEHLMGTDKSISAFQLSYNLGLLDSVNAIGYYNWNSNKSGWFLGWKRTYDNLVINISGFWSEENIGGAFLGKGLQVMLSFNH